MCQPVSVSPRVACNLDVRQERYKAIEVNTVAGVDEDAAAGEDGVVGPLEGDAPPPEQLAAESAAASAPTFSLPKLAELREKLAGASTASVVVAGLGLVGGAIGAYFLWPAAAGVAAAATMKAPGAAGLLISRPAFEANPKLYYLLKRTVGVAAAVAAFAA